MAYLTRIILGITFQRHTKIPRISISTILCTCTTYLFHSCIMGKSKKKARAKTVKTEIKVKANSNLTTTSKRPKAAEPNTLALPDFSIPKSLAEPVRARGFKPVKLPALFRKHLGLLEAHVKTLDLVKQSLQSGMEGLSEEEKREWELDENGNWRVICEMMDRARVTLSQAEMAAGNIVSAALVCVSLPACILGIAEGHWEAIESILLIIWHAVTV